jgi:hypothetical protein
MINVLFIIILRWFWIRKLFFGIQALPKKIGGHMLTTKVSTVVQTGQTGVTNQTGVSDFTKVKNLTSPLRISCREDQNSYLERPIWSLGERFMTSERLDPDRTGQTSSMDWSDQFQVVF